MSDVTEGELLAAIKTQMMTAAETIDTTKYTVIGSPSFEAATVFPNGREEKFLDLNGSSQYVNFDPTTDVPNMNSLIISYWIKPDFTQSWGTPIGIFDGFISNDPVAGQHHGIGLNFNTSFDDFAVTVAAYPNQENFYTTGETWSADSVMHQVILSDYTGALDNGKVGAAYINNSLAASASNTSYTVDAELRNPTDIGRSIGCGYGYFNGGIFDFAILDYDMLSASHTDAEIVQALYDNDFNDGEHKFLYELGDTSTPGLSIAGRKVRIQTNTGVSATTALEIDSAQGITIAESIVPITDNNSDLGSVDNEFKDLYLDGTANIDSLVADTADINAGTIDDTSIGSTTPSTGDFTTLANSGTYIQDNGNVILNNDNGDYDFTVKKNTAGVAIQYDAGDDNTCIGDGGTTNYTEIKSDGEIVLHGTARVTKSLWVPAESLKHGGTSPATWANIGISGAYRFADGAEDEIVALIGLPSDMDRSVAPDLKVGWATDDTNENDCEWYAEFLYRAIGEDMSAVADFTDTQTDTAVAQANGLNVHSIDMDTLGSSDMCIQIKLTRLAKAGSNDTIADNVDLYGICLEYTANTLGTAT